MDITVEELKQRMDAGEDLLIIDVREQHEYQEFNIGAVHIPLSTVPMRMYDFDDEKDREIIVHCRSGVRSNTAKMMMMQSGFTNVRNLIGGMLEWQAKFPG
ncbi:MAG TPA: rhodanese-like domain-containing protein [Chitinophagales bacterium]|jgi:rhodanese-related sulfurtransferase|nr:rhodanese-like domain-containing protein [Chitinophagales bacterium]